MHWARITGKHKDLLQTRRGVPALQRTFFPGAKCPVIQILIMNIKRYKALGHGKI